MAKETKMARIGRYLTMLKKGRSYETEQTKRTKKQKANIEAAETLKRELSRPVETEEERKKRLAREKKERESRMGGGGFVGAQNVDKTYHKIAGK